VVPDPREVADCDFPGIGNPDGRAHDNTHADLCAKEPQQRSSPSV
jgi:hypothetical protein